ncbi:MAG: hypothetical protein ACSLE8_15560 [Rhodococcus sp. (in: high G+C Gram-positive bacteria)]
MATNLTLIVDGVADLLEVATGRDNTVNLPALSIIVRSALEVGGQVAWLLDDGVDGSELGRRFLTWRFADLRQRRLLLEDFRPTNEVREAALDDVGKDEEALLADVASAKWSARCTVVKPNGLEAAALLDDAGKREHMPKFNELVGRITSWRSAYGLLSASVHSDRFGVFHGLAVDDVPDRTGQHNAQMTGFGIEPKIGIGLALLAIDRSCRLLAKWNGVDPSRLHREVLVLMERVGIA